MFIDATGIILADDKRVQLSELSHPRALAAVPFAGRYRIIDFGLSNMVNSGITLVGVSTLNKYKSLMDHLGTGSAWDLDRKNQGLHILPPYLTSENYYNESDDLKGLLDFIRSGKNKYVIIASSNVVFTADYSDLMAKHIETGADITVMYNRDGIVDGSSNVILDIDRRGKVKDVVMNPEKPASNRNSLGVLVMGKELLVDLLADAVAHGVSNLTTELILRKCDLFDIRGFEFKEPALRINSIQSYFKASMALLDPKVSEAIFWGEDPVYTKVKDEAPAYLQEGVSVKNCLVSDGCLISGDVDNSILFRGVSIGKGCKIKNSVIFQGVTIGDNVELDHVIIDKDCTIRQNTRLMGQIAYPVVIGKGATI